MSSPSIPKDLSRAQLWQQPVYSAAMDTEEDVPDVTYTEAGGTSNSGSGREGQFHSSDSTNYSSENSTSGDVHQERELPAAVTTKKQPTEQHPPRACGPYELKDLPTLQARIRGYVDDAIEAMPADSAAYLEAKRRAPEVVAAETDPLQFIRYCNYDLYAGAKRLCLYWTHRKNDFGDERAFLPLVITGTGALAVEDVLSLQEGYPALLPDTTNGKKVFYFDRRHFLQDSTNEQRLRCLYYLCRILAQDDGTQVDGALALFLLATPRLHAIDYSLLKKELFLFSQVFPIKVEIHFLSIPNQVKNYIVEDMIKSVVSVVMEQFQSNKVRMHVQQKPNEIRDGLLQLGLTHKAIPRIFGGGFEVDDFYVWCRDRHAVELQCYRGWLRDPPKRNRVNWRNRLVKNMEVVQLKEESSALMHENVVLRSEHERLQDLLNKATAYANSIEE